MAGIPEKAAVQISEEIQRIKITRRYYVADLCQDTFSPPMVFGSVGKYEFIMRNDFFFNFSKKG